MASSRTSSVASPRPRILKCLFHRNAAATELCMHVSNRMPLTQFLRASSPIDVLRVRAHAIADHKLPVTVNTMGESLRVLYGLERPGCCPECKLLVESSAGVGAEQRQRACRCPSKTWTTQQCWVRCRGPQTSTCDAWALSQLSRPARWFTAFSELRLASCGLLVIEITIRFGI